MRGAGRGTQPPFRSNARHSEPSSGRFPRYACRFWFCGSQIPKSLHIYRSRRVAKGHQKGSAKGVGVSREGIRTLDLIIS